jgi:hypothetical protein
MRLAPLVGLSLLAGYGCTNSVEVPLSSSIRYGHSIERIAEAYQHYGYTYETDNQGVNLLKNENGCEVELHIDKARVIKSYKIISDASLCMHRRRNLGLQ